MFEKMCGLHEKYTQEIHELNLKIENFLNEKQATVARQRDAVEQQKLTIGLLKRELADSENEVRRLREKTQMAARSYQDRLEEMQTRLKAAAKLEKDNIRLQEQVLDLEREA